MIFLRALVIFIQLLTFGSVTLATFVYEQTDEQSFYSMTFEDYLIENGITEDITVTNKAQNGQFTTDSNSDGLADSWQKFSQTTGTLENGIQRINLTTPTVNMVLYQSINFSSSTNYYVNFSWWKKSLSFPGNQYLYLTGSTEQSILLNSNANWSNSYSNIFVSNYANTSMRFYSYYSSGFIEGDYFEVDNVVILESNSYTKSQLDTFIANYGYPVYNIATSGYDELDTDFQTAYTDFFGSYTDFTVSDLSEIRYYGYTMTKAEIGLTEVVILTGCIFGWVVFIGIMRRFL